MRILLLVLFLIPSIASAGGRQEVKREDFGDAWPFTVNQGAVVCRGSGSVLFVTDRKIYAINGLAKSDGVYEDVREIWRDNASTKKYGPPKVSIDPIITIGLSLCN